jgi:hypothetical protein
MRMQLHNDNNALTGSDAVYCQDPSLCAAMQCAMSHMTLKPPQCNVGSATGVPGKPRWSRAKYAAGQSYQCLEQTNACSGAAGNLERCTMQPGCNNVVLMPARSANGKFPKMPGPQMYKFSRHHLTAYAHWHDICLRRLPVAATVACRHLISDSTCFHRS